MILISLFSVNTRHVVFEQQVANRGTQPVRREPSFLVLPPQERSSIWGRSRANSNDVISSIQRATPQNERICNPLARHGITVSCVPALALLDAWCWSPRYGTLSLQRIEE